MKEWKDLNITSTMECWKLLANVDLRLCTYIVFTISLSVDNPKL